MARVFFSIAYLLLVAGIIHPQPAQADDDNRFARTIAVSGEGEITVVPDQLVITLEARTEAPDADTAQESNNKKINAVLKIANDFDIPTKDIKSPRTRINPQYDYVDSKRILRHYVASATITLKTKRFDHYGRLMQALTKAGINHVNQVHYQIEDDKPLREQALVLAVEHARSKAEKLAKAAKVDVGDVLSIRETSVQLPSPMPLAAPKMRMMAAEADMAGGAPALPGDMEIRQTIDVVFELQ